MATGDMAMMKIDAILHDDDFREYGTVTETMTTTMDIYVNIMIKALMAR